MYKSKLQELCQKQKWALPEYTCIRDGGEDHVPLFEASVTVRGLTFHGPPTCGSSKQAHNEAARLAFLHFTPESSNQRHKNVEKTNHEKDVQSVVYSDNGTAVMNNENLGDDKRNEFKMKLEIYARKKNLKVPVYRNEKEGILVRGRVCIDEEWFQSPTLCETVEEADDSAAQAALLSLSTDAFHENDPRSYKILLHELAKDEGFFSPIYTTTKCDESRLQTFSSTVDVEGEIFQGAIAKSKKLAELNAAKAAYTAFMERKLFEPGYFSPRSSGDDILKLAPRWGSVTIGENEETTDDVKEKSKNTTETKSYLLCNRVKIFRSVPNMALPKGTVLLPISEDKWTIVTLDFPSQKGT